MKKIKLKFLLNDITKKNNKSTGPWLVFFVAFLFDKNTLVDNIY